MTCTRLGPYGHKVHQDQVDHITTDRALFSFLRKQVAFRYGRVYNLFSWTCIQEIYFVKVSVLCLESLTKNYN
jgi:hypothetical protein